MDFTTTGDKTVHVVSRSGVGCKAHLSIHHVVDTALAIMRLAASLLFLASLALAQDISQDEPLLRGLSESAMAEWSALYDDRSLLNAATQSDHEAPSSKSEDKTSSEKKDEKETAEETPVRKFRAKNLSARTQVKTEEAPPKKDEKESAEETPVRKFRAKNLSARTRVKTEEAPPKKDEKESSEETPVRKFRAKNLSARTRVKKTDANEAPPKKDEAPPKKDEKESAEETPVRK
ncbi:hypothetical protein AeNC1_018692, partial [Aphanomyces euteiches]